MSAPRTGPGHGRAPLVTSDPERMRALAHPLRLRLLSLLDDEGEATATRCAEVTGESVASCSFHLRMLAKYGFVEPAERRGREKPWRAVGQGRTTRFDPDVPGSLVAAGEVAALQLDELARAVEALTDRFAGRWDDPSLRPPGARPSRLLGVVNADVPAGGDAH